LVPAVEHAVARRQGDALEEIAGRRGKLVLAERVFYVLGERTLDRLSIRAEIAFRQIASCAHAPRGRPTASEHIGRGGTHRDFLATIARRRKSCVLPASLSP